MKSAKRYGQLTAAGVVVAALITGCGSSGGGKSASNVAPTPGSSKADTGNSGTSIQELLAASVTKTDSAKNAKLHLEFKGTFGGKELSFAGDGIADFAGKNFRLTLNLPASTGIAGSIEERVIGGKFYLKLPAAAQAVTGGKPWVAIDASALGGSGSSNGLGSLGQDPTQFLNTLKSVSSSITNLGTADVRGVKTTHYRAQVDLQKAISSSGSSTASLAEVQKLLGSKTLPEDVYLDDQGYPRRFAVTITMATGSAAAAQTGTISTTVDMYDFGTTDTSGIVVPPASEVGSLPTGAGGLTG